MNHTSEPVLAAYGVSFRWQSAAPQNATGTLDEITFELNRGEIVGLFGPNGSGKSTLMKIAAGLLPLNRPGCSGQVRFRNQNLYGLSPRERAQRVIYVAPELQAEFPLTALEVVSMGRHCHGQGLIHHASSKEMSILQSAMERCLCWGLRDRLFHTLSGGERQLVALACALVQDTQVLFLDEALSRMDLNHQASMGRLLKELAKEGRSILVVSHDLNLALGWADTVLFLKDGKKVLHGPTAEVIQENEIRKVYPGANLAVVKNPLTGASQVFFG